MKPSKLLKTCKATGSEDEILSACEKLIQECPKFADARNVTGLVWKLVWGGKEGEGLERAVDFYERMLAGVKQERLKRDLLLGLGNVQRELGDTESSLACYEAALHIHPTHGATHHLLGMVYDNLNQDLKASYHFTRALAAKPCYSPSHVSLQALVKKHKSIGVGGGSNFETTLLRTTFLSNKKGFHKGLASVEKHLENGNVEVGQLLYGVSAVSCLAASKQNVKIKQDLNLLVEKLLDYSRMNIPDHSTVFGWLENGGDSPAERDLEKILTDRRNHFTSDRDSDTSSCSSDEELVVASPTDFCEFFDGCEDDEEEEESNLFQPISVPPPHRGAPSPISFKAFTPSVPCRAQPTGFAHYNARHHLRIGLGQVV
eukprot:TRINITY_DN1526_c2_g2_i1.p1 TRINITY_DN1526_c2_g2~~TRINITY_DN1526_c2_g2_i1.p1  ORF type:complete len:389 (+),score=59.59 TRINITY_DN1526_c2_g2_i1:51-1169(+)